MVDIDHYRTAVRIFAGIAYQIFYSNADKSFIRAYDEIADDTYFNTQLVHATDKFRHSYLFLIVGSPLFGTSLRELQEFVHDVDDTIRFARYALKIILIFVGTAVAHQGHLTFALYGGKSIVDFVRRIVDKHLLGMIILVDTVEYARSIQSTNQIEYKRRH